MRPVLVLRPQPGADATAAKATARGLEVIVAPLFRIAKRDWKLPAEPFDALLVTSANAARGLDQSLDRTLPVFAVGAATAVALRDVGFHNLTIGTEGVEQLVAMAAVARVGVLLHLAGEDRTDFDPGRLRVETRIVYASEPCAPDPAFSEALARGAVALLHSARAASGFRNLAGTGHRIAAISPAVLDVAGSGWSAAAVALRPTDDALLAAAAALCH
jgi:uroporphyrinogen-III synthase